MGEDAIYHVVVKADTIENAEEKARDLAEAPPKRGYDYRGDFLYRLSLSEVREEKL